jgi:hypothetical protein
MTANKGIRAELPDGIKIGQRFLLRFDDPRVETGAYQGRLQDMSKSGLLCFDAPSNVRPPKGTPVTVRSIQQGAGAGSCGFSSEIRGHGRLRGKVPVLLVYPPENFEDKARRGAHRVSVCLRGNMKWREAPRCPQQQASAVIINLSGGGAQIYSRQQPDAKFIELTISAPTPFIEETARRSLPRGGMTPRRMSLAANPFRDACDRMHERFFGIRTRVVSSRVHSRDERGPVYALCLAFCDQQEGCYQLVRFLERQSARKGIDPASETTRRGNPLATAA